MILRRLTQHIKAQNWFAVWLDFLIVVVGVFIGLQVSNWNAERANLERARDYLERLEADLAADAKNIYVREQFNSQVLAYGDKALAYAEADAEARSADWPTVLAFFQASQIFNYFRNNATYDELKSAGELNLLSDQNLRSALAEYFVTSSGSQSQIFEYIPDYRETVRGLKPSKVTQHVWQNCHRNEGLDAKQVLIECDSPISPNEAQQILDGYLAHPELIRQLRFWMSTLTTTQNLLGIAHSNTENLRADIVAQLSK